MEETLSLIRVYRINSYFVFCSFVYFTLFENFIYALYLFYCIWVFVSVYFVVVWPSQFLGSHLVILVLCTDSIQKIV